MLHVAYLGKWLYGSGPGDDFVVLRPAGLLAALLDILPAVHDGAQHALVLFHAVALDEPRQYGLGKDALHLWDPAWLGDLGAGFFGEGHVVFRNDISLALNWIKLWIKLLL